MYLIQSQAEPEENYILCVCIYVCVCVREIMMVRAPWRTEQLCILLT